MEHGSRRNESVGEAIADLLSDTRKLAPNGVTGSVRHAPGAASRSISAGREWSPAVCDCWDWPDPWWATTAGAGGPSAFSGLHRPERIADGEAVDYLAVFHVFRKEDVAACLEGGCDDQRSVDAIAVSSGDAQRPVVGLHGERDGRRAQHTKRAERLQNVLPGHGEFAHGDRNELVQCLHTNHAASGKKGFGDRCAGRIPACPTMHNATQRVPPYATL